MDHCITPDGGKGLVSEAAHEPFSSASQFTFNHASEVQTAAYDKFFQENQERHLGELAKLVAMPTLWMDPNHRADTQKAAEYLNGKLDAIGMQNVTIHLPDYPFVMAEWMNAPGQPTALFYGHFDVQPAVPEKWDTDPYKAVIKDRKMFGRGATDDKGPNISFLSVLEAMMKIDGKLPVNVKWLLDGSEENGSQQMPAWLEIPEVKAWAQAADYAFNLDSMMQSDDQGLLWKSLRGTVAFQVKLTTTKGDLHSGIFGGIAPNAAVAASKLIASLYNDDGTLAVAGFNESINPIGTDDKQNIEEAMKGIDMDVVMERYGLTQVIGESDYSPLERAWLRGSGDVTGLKSGYTEGSGSIVPAESEFFITCRLEPGQDPEKIAESFVEHIEKQTPWGIKPDVKVLGKSNAVFNPSDDPSYRLSKAVQTEFYGMAPVEAYVGGSVPAISFLNAAGVPAPVSLGIQRSDENFHGDNEYMRIARFEKGQRLYAMMLHALVGQPSQK